MGGLFLNVALSQRSVERVCFSSVLKRSAVRFSGLPPLRQHTELPPSHCYSLQLSTATQHSHIRFIPLFHSIYLPALSVSLVPFLMLHSCTVIYTHIVFHMCSEIKCLSLCVALSAFNSHSFSFLLCPLTSSCLHSTFAVWQTKPDQSKHCFWIISPPIPILPLDYLTVELNSEEIQIHSCCRFVQLVVKKSDVKHSTIPGESATIKPVRVKDILKSSHSLEKISNTKSLAV